MRNIVGNGNGRRKSKSEARAYRQSIKSNTTPLESTVDLRNNNLSGSAEANNIAFLDSSTQSAKISFRLRAKRFFKTHIFESVLGALMAIIVALAGWPASPRPWCRPASGSRQPRHTAPKCGGGRTGRRCPSSREPPRR